MKSGLSPDSIVDDCYPVSDINGWEILLTKDPKNRSQELRPDWYGYLRIDKDYSGKLEH